MSRAIRRHHEQRVKARAKRIARRAADEYVDITDWYVRNANHLKSCSCWMCGNPRKYFGELTPQEILAEPLESDLQ